MQNVRIGIRLVVGFVFVAGLSLLIGVVGYRGMKVTGQALTTVSEVSLPGVEALAQIRYNLRNLVVVQRTLLNPYLSESQRAQQHSNFSSAREAYQKAMVRYEALPKSPAEAEAWQGFKDILPEVRSNNDEATRLFKEWEKNTANQEVFKQLSDVVVGKAQEQNARLMEAISKVFAANLKQAEQGKSAALSQMDADSKIMFAVMIAAPLLSLLLGIYLTRSIVRPLRLGVDFATSVADGQLDTRLDLHQGDEIGILADKLRIMLDTLKSKIAAADQSSKEAAAAADEARAATALAKKAQDQAERAKAEGMAAAAESISEVVMRVTSAGEELSAQVEHSSRGAARQNERAQDTATAMEQMNATVLEVAHSASRASQSAEEVKTKAREGSQVVAGVVQDMREVETRAENLKTDMGGLAEAAQDIGRIVSVISDIADQTNLLALNAAIEAARAGDAGRGFAVVADEVRKLAEKTASATKEVTQAVSGIQTGARAGAASVELAVNNIRQAAGKARDSGEALAGIVMVADQAGDQIRSIASAAEEQSATSEEITKAIEEMSHISAETAEGMKQSAQAVSELADQASELSRIIEAMRSEQDVALHGGSRPKALGRK